VAGSFIGATLCEALGVAQARCVTNAGDAADAVEGGQRDGYPAFLGRVAVDIGAPLKKNLAR